MQYVRFLIDYVMISILLLKLEDVYASSDVNIVMMFFELFLLRKISEFPSGTRTHNHLKVVGSSLAWKLGYFSE